MMVAAMKLWITACLAAASLAFAEEMPPVENAIPGPVKALAAPIDVQFQGGLVMAVTATTENAQAQVLQGLNHLHGGWEFEASRHFAAAMKEDPDCLLAHWGMVMCLLSPSPENDDARIAATDRLLELINQGKGNELERGYAYGLVKYIEEGPAMAAEAFRKVSDKFPNDMQASIFTALFSRTGYDVLGTATPDQLEAEKRLEALAKKFPESPLPLHALLTIRAESPDLTGSIELARKLTKMAPNYAPYFHVLGHYEWRSGNHGRATSAFGRAASLFETWREENKATLADCPEWVKSECYRIVALSSKGDFETSYAAARRVAEIPLPEKRLGSDGARILLWEAKTLPARLLMKRGLPGNTVEALHSLPVPEDIKATRAVSLAFWYIDGLRLALDSKRQIEAGDLEGAKQTAAVLAQHGQKMGNLQNAAAKGGERSALTRAFGALEVLASEINGRISLAGPKENRGSANNWFRSARDRQRLATLLYPPPVLAPMSARVGEFYLAVNRPKDAIEPYQEALEAFPNDIDSLKGLEKSFQLSSMPKEAAETAERIKILEEQQ